MNAFDSVPNPFPCPHSFVFIVHAALCKQHSCFSPLFGHLRQMASRRVPHRIPPKSARLPASVWRHDGEPRLRDGKLDWYRDDQPLKEKGYTTRLIAKEASRLIREQPADKPLFLYVPFNGIHSPFQVPDSDAKPYKNLPKLRHTVAGMLAVVDEAIGQITAALEEKGMRDNTLIIFSSDNGGAHAGKGTMNTPLRAGKGSTSGPS